MAPFRLPICAGLRYKPAMKIHFSVLLLFPFLAVALPAQAEVFKCRQPDGSTQISSEPCSGGASTIKTIQDDAVPEAAREQAERDVQRQRQMANQMKSERQADEAAERKEQEALRKASGAPSQAAVLVGGAVVLLAIVVERVPARHLGVRVDVDRNQFFVFHGGPRGVGELVNYQN